MIVLNLKNSDIKWTKHKNGEEYATIVVEKKKEIDQYGNDWVAYNSQSKEDRQSKLPKKYVGNGKEYTF